MICPLCDNTFVTTMPNKMYCCVACRDRAARLRRLRETWRLSVDEQKKRNELIILYDSLQAMRY